MKKGGSRQEQGRKLVPVGETRDLGSFINDGLVRPVCKSAGAIRPASQRGVVVSMR